MLSHSPILKILSAAECWEFRQVRENEEASEKENKMWRITFKELAFGKDISAL